MRLRYFKGALGGSQIKGILFLLLICIVLLDAFAQEQFVAGIHAGIIASQLDGDNYTGYDKFGLRIGARVERRVGQKIEISIELNYEEKGSRFESRDGRPVMERNRIIQLTYAEVPIIVRWYHKTQKRLFFESGIALSYMLDHRFRVIGTRGNLLAFESIASEFSRSELNLILGLGHRFSDKVGIYFRTSIGLIPFYENAAAREEKVPFTPRPFGTPSPEIINHLRNYLISAGFSYML